MANIREQCSWVHDDRAEATEKAKALVTCAPSSAWSGTKPLERMSVDMCPNTLIIGGGIAGHDGRPGAGRRRQPRLPGRTQDHLGGNVARIDLTAPYLDSARDLLTERITRVMEHPKINVLLRGAGP